MNEYRIMFSDDITDSITIKADSFVVCDDTITFNRLIDDNGHFEAVAIFNRLDIVGIVKDN